MPPSSEGRAGWIGIVGWDEVPGAVSSDHLPSFVGLQPVVMRTQPPQVLELGATVFFERDDVVDLEEPKP